MTSRASSRRPAASVPDRPAARSRTRRSWMCPAARQRLASAECDRGDETEGVPMRASSRLIRAPKSFITDWRALIAALIWGLAVARTGRASAIGEARSAANGRKVRIRIMTEVPRASMAQLGKTVGSVCSRSAWQRARAHRTSTRTSGRRSEPDWTGLLSFEIGLPRYVRVHRSASPTRNLRWLAALPFLGNLVGPFVFEWASRDCRAAGARAAG